MPLSAGMRFAYHSFQASSRGTQRLERLRLGCATRPSAALGPTVGSPRSDVLIRQHKAPFSEANIGATAPSLAVIAVIHEYRSAVSTEEGFHAGDYRRLGRFPFFLREDEFLLHVPLFSVADCPPKAVLAEHCPPRSRAVPTASLINKIAV